MEKSSLTLQDYGIQDPLKSLKQPDNSLIFIQVIGGHAVGKSNLLGSLAVKYKDNLEASVLGKYKPSKTSEDLMTGGMDAESMTNAERFSMIEKFWLDTSKKVIACEGMIISYYGSFLQKYFELQRKVPRKVFIIYLFTEHAEVLNRIKRRSNGKEMNPKRLANIVSKDKTAKSTFSKVHDSESWKKLSFNTTTVEGLNQSFNEVDKIFFEALK